ncbi:MAG: hypothetical protein VKP70_09645, partial [Cyanobacteriota bacterium]|nr:hypothetical protein [Cyanobacteriota bacterium]
ALHMFRYWWSLPGAQLRFSDAQRTVLDLNAAEQLRPILEQNLQTILRDLNTSRRRRAKLPPKVFKSKASMFAESLAEEAIVCGETSFMAALGLHREQSLITVSKGFMVWATLGARWASGERLTT